MLRAQVAAISTGVKLHLARARAAGAHKLSGTPVAVAGVVEDLHFSMALMYRARGISLEATGLDGVAFRGDRQDLEEMLGNLIENGCTRARGRLRVSATQADGRLRVRVEDDGPGLPEGRLGDMLVWGGRLDEAAPGSGLGMSIVQDLAGLYRGSLHLSRSPLGGLCAELDLPA